MMLARRQSSTTCMMQLEGSILRQMAQIQMFSEYPGDAAAQPEHRLKKPGFQWQQAKREKRCAVLKKLIQSGGRPRAYRAASKE
jgi:hypothetical protein